MAVGTVATGSSSDVRKIPSFYSDEEAALPLSQAHADLDQSWAQAFRLMSRQVHHRTTEPKAVDCTGHAWPARCGVRRDDSPYNDELDGGCKLGCNGGFIYTVAMEQKESQVRPRYDGYVRTS